MDIRDHARNAVQCLGSDCTIEDNRIGPTGTPGTYAAIVIKSGSARNAVLNNRIGTPGALAQPDAIVVEDGYATDHDIRGNRSQLSVVPTYDPSLATQTGDTTAHVVSSFTLPLLAGRPSQFGLDIKAAGSISGTAGIKTVKLKINGTARATLTTLAADTGGWSLTARIDKRDGSASGINFNGQFMVGTTAQAPAHANPAINPNTTDILIELEFTLANAGDTITRELWSVQPINDQVRKAA